jgi:hypothetical protein
MQSSMELNAKKIIMFTESPFSQLHAFEIYKCPRGKCRKASHLMLVKELA